jgi:hypothetical protein
LAFVQNIKSQRSDSGTMPTNHAGVVEKQGQNSLRPFLQQGEVTKPIAQILLQALQEMLKSEQNQESTPKCQQPIVDFDHIRYRSIAIIIELSQTGFFKKPCERPQMGQTGVSRYPAGC